MCADGSCGRPEDAVGECLVCESRVDDEGYTVEECCNYAEWQCEECGYAPCTGRC